MSKVAIKGNASGTGTFTLEAPNSNTDRTLVLPDEAGTVLTNTAPSIAGGVTFSQEAASSPYPEQQIKWSNDSTTANGFYISQDSDRNGRVWHEQGLELLFGTGDTERMRIDSSGRLALNTTSPNTSYQMTIQANSTTGALSIDGPSTNGYWAAEWDMPSGSTYGILFKNAGSNVGNIRINASSTSYNTSSDYRLKENVVDMTDAIDRVKALPVRRFNFIADPDTTVDGFLAHEAQEIVPEAVSGDKDAVDADGNAVMQGIDQSKLVPLLTGALKEAIAKIETLEAKVAALEATP